MDIDEAHQLLSRCHREQLDARIQIADAQSTLESSRLIIQGILRKFPDLADGDLTLDADWDAQGTQPVGADAVLQILQVDEGQQFTVRGLVELLESRGWSPNSANPANAVRTALERLVKMPNRGVHKGRDNDGTVIYWFYEPDREPAPAAEPQGYGYSEEPF
jgi:hypothetical protein